MSEHDATRLSRRALFDLVWSKPMTAIAADFETRDYHVRALCKRLALPIPAGGHWMKAEVGKAPPTPPYPADQKLDGEDYQFTRPVPRASCQDSSAGALRSKPAEDGPVPKEGLQSRDTRASVTRPRPHKLVSATRAALAKRSTGARTAVGGPGKFRLFIAPGSAERAGALLDALTVMMEARGWALCDSPQGFQLVPDGEPIGFAIEEKLDARPHVRTAAEDRAFADYERQCALAERGIGYRPWRPPAIPTHDYEPNGMLALKLDDGLRVERLRRTFADGKRQRLEDLLPDISRSLEVWARGRKEWRARQERWKQEERERQARQRAAENRARTDGYRLAFLRRQSERLAEIERIERLLEHWRQGDDHPSLRDLSAWARRHCAQERSALAADSVGERVERLRLMDDDIHIFDLNSLG